MQGQLHSSGPPQACPDPLHWPRSALTEACHVHVLEVLEARIRRASDRSRRPCTTAFAQTPTFSLEGVVSDAQQAVLPGATVTITNTATGLTRAVVTDAGGRYVIASMPTEGRYRVQVELTGFANAVREDIVFNAGQRALINFSLQLSTVQETITVAGDAPIVQTTSSEVSTHDRSPGVRNAAGQGAQLLPPADARLERRRQRHGLQRPQRRRPGGVELRHLRRWHQQPLEVADAAARAAARIERLRDRNGQGSAAHHQPVLGRVRRPLRRRVEHDHQDRHQRSSTARRS